MAADRAAPWEPLTPWQVPGLLAGLGVTWWVAGGWALDLAAGRVTRSHGDLDLGVFRADLGAVFDALPAFELFAARGGALSPVASACQVAADVNSLWCRRRDSGRWRFELMLDEREGNTWLYRRDPAIRRPIDALLQPATGGPPALRPEVQLLYKAKQVRERDELDFRTHAPALDGAARGWLRDALRRAHPRHPWLASLRATRG